jgi:hypothetical protein
VSTPRRWPLHPRPGPDEALSSWLARVAGVYGLPVRDLLRHNLGQASALADDPAAADLDWDPPAAVLAALDERTGAGVGELRRMTIAGWVPWLLDTLDDGGQEAFDTYVRQHSVLLAPGKAGRSAVPRWRPWLPERQARPARRICPVCAADPDRGTPLAARLPIMTSCAGHGVRLKPEPDVAFTALAGQVPPEPAAAHAAAMDRLTYQGLTTGLVTLPRRAVHAGVWFRLLRTLLDELSMPLSRVGARSGRTLDRIWRATGRPVRAGLKVWRPFERLDWPRQEAMLEAAAIALHLAETGAITARGTLGPLLSPEPPRAVYDGDERARAAYQWKRAQEELSAAIAAARTDPGAARQMLGILTYGCRTLTSFDRERQYLIDLGIPAGFLPGAGELGCADLLAGQP